MRNPSLREEPRHQPAPVIPSAQDVSILDWLERNGRLIARDDEESEFVEDEEEISALMGADDSSYDDDDDDFDVED